MTRLRLALYALLHADLRIPRHHLAWTTVGLVGAAITAVMGALGGR